MIIQYIDGVCSRNAPKVPGRPRNPLGLRPLRSIRLPEGHLSVRHEGMKKGIHKWRLSWRVVSSILYN